MKVWNPDQSRFLTTGLYQDFRHSEIRIHAAKQDVKKLAAQTLSFIFSFSASSSSATLATLSTFTLEPNTLILSVSMGVFAIRIRAFSIFWGCRTPGFLFRRKPEWGKKKSNFKMAFYYKMKLSMGSGKTHSHTEGGQLRHVLDEKEPKSKLKSERSDFRRLLYSECMKSKLCRNRNRRWFGIQTVQISDIWGFGITCTPQLSEIRTGHPTIIQH